VASNSHNGNRETWRAIHTPPGDDPVCDSSRPQPVRTAPGATNGRLSYLIAEWTQHHAHATHSLRNDGEKTRTENETFASRGTRPIGELRIIPIVWRCGENNPCSPVWINDIRSQNGSPVRPDPHTSLQMVRGREQRASRNSAEFGVAHCNVLWSMQIRYSGVAARQVPSDTSAANPSSVLIMF
jgi:hypothetical protein